MTRKTCPFPHFSEVCRLTLASIAFGIHGFSEETCSFSTAKCTKSPIQALFWDATETEKEPKPNLLSPDIFRWGRGLPREGVGAKKFGMSLETREIKLFGRDIPGCCWRRKSLREKSLCSSFGP